MPDKVTAATVVGLKSRLDSRDRAQVHRDEIDAIAATLEGYERREEYFEAVEARLAACEERDCTCNPVCCRCGKRCGEDSAQLDCGCWACSCDCWEHEAGPAESPSNHRCPTTLALARYEQGPVLWAVWCDEPGCRYHERSGPIEICEFERDARSWTTIEHKTIRIEPGRLVPVEK